MRFVPLLHCTVLLFFLHGINGQLITPQCLVDVGHMLEQAVLDQGWALRMIDSITKLPDGFLYGNLDQMGHWDECLDAASGTGFTGKYCRAGLAFENPSPRIFNQSLVKKAEALQRHRRTLPDGGAFSLRAALCLPSSCTTGDFEFLGAQLLGLLSDPTTEVTVTVDPRECYTLDTKIPDLDGWGIAAISVFGLLIACVVACTVLEYFDKGGDMVKAASARRTYAQLVSVKEGAFDCVNGIKVLSMLWIMLGHRYELSVLATPSSNFFAVFDLTQSPMFMTLGNGYLSVDTFFLVGGFLLAFGFFREMKKGTAFDVIKFYVYRYIRLTVPLAAMVVFYLTLLQYLGSGPVWYPLIHTRLIGSCKSYWWAAVCYVNNYVGTLKMCVEQSWYTSVDMQLAFLSPLLLLPMQYAPRAGKQLAGLVVLISCFIPFTITYLNDYPWSVNLVNNLDYDVLEFTDEIYLATHSRASPYIAGIVLGYIMTKVPQKKLFWNWKTITLGWIFSTAVCLSIMYTLSISYQYDYVYEPVGAAFYGGFHRLGWAIGLSWVIFACTKGMGGPVNAILSWRLFSILSPLIYGVYLVHFMVISVQVGAKRVPDYASHYNVIHNFLGDIPFSFGGACLIYFVVEAPLMVVLKQIFRKQIKPKGEKKIGKTETP